ncbi:MAG: hypothetical protein RLZZ231_1247 [Bacteroidota bacterium]|jgi:uncharacterized protein YdcH (DUF465 family)
MQKHNLINEFPEFETQIHELKVSNHHFKKLFDEYHEVEHKIYLINSEVEVATDEETHKLKAHALHLKDGLLEIIKNS